jgi:hypothetical protein
MTASTVETMVKIISIWSKWDCLEGVVTGRDQNVEYDVQVPLGDTDLETLDNAFGLTNQDDRPLRHKVCSTTAGDIMVLDGQHYLVEGIGFAPITAEQSAAIQKLSSRDTSAGLAFLTKHNLI